MKHKSIKIIAVFTLMFTFACEDYLDVDPGIMGFDETRIFTEYVEYQRFLILMYHDLAKVYDVRDFANNRTTGPTIAAFPNTISDQLRSPDKSANEDLLMDIGWVESTVNGGGVQTANNIALWGHSWRAIKQANLAIANHHLLENATQEQKDGLLGQAHMGRALAYQFLVGLYGGMPYVTKPITPDNLDLERDSYYRTCLNIAADSDTAAMLLPARWDEGLTQLPNGSFDPASPYVHSSDSRRFTSLVALGIKSRALLYAASPFAQDSKTAEDMGRSTQQDWEAAAIAANAAIVLAEENGYILLPYDKILENFSFNQVNAEMIYSIPDGMWGHQHAASGLFGRFSTPFSLTQRTSEVQAGVLATHNIAERFEAVKYENGVIVSARPIVTYTANGVRTYHGADADMADHYNEQNPFNDPLDLSSDIDPPNFAKPSPVYPGHEGYGRDPRFYRFMIYHGRAIDRWGFAGTTWDETLTNYGGGNLWQNYTGDRRLARRFDLSIGSYDRKQIQSPTFDNTTGYFTGKFWSLGVNNNLGSYDRTHHHYPVIRTAELYLNYAEAANQAYGGPGGRSPGARYSAAEAVNVVRNRAKMPDVDTGRFSSKDAFHERVYNERAVELCFEAYHPFVDPRRWKLLDTQGYSEVLKMDIVLDGNADTNTYPTGYIFTPDVLEVKNYDPKHYLLPVSRHDTERMRNFLQNPGY